MADEILRRDKSQTTDRTGKALHLQLAGQPTCSTYDDEWILPEDYLAPEQAAIEVNEDAIAVLETETALLNEITTKRLIQSINIPTPITQDKDEHFYKVIFRQVSGTSNVGIGTVSDDGDIAKIRVIDDPTGYKTITTSIAPSVADRTIYFIVQGGVVDIAIYSSINVFRL